MLAKPRITKALVQTIDRMWPKTFIPKPSYLPCSNAFVGYRVLPTSGSEAFRDEGFFRVPETVVKSSNG